MITRRALLVGLAAYMTVAALGRSTAEAAPESAGSFYRSLAEAITDTRFNANLYLEGGNFRLTKNGTPPLDLQIPEGVFAVTTAEYKNKSLSSAKLSFSQRVRARAKVDSDVVAVSFKELGYDSSGEMVSNDFKIDNLFCLVAFWKSLFGHRPDLGKSARLIAMNVSPESIFLARPFRKDQSLLKCDAGFRNCVEHASPLVSELRFQTSPFTPALEASIGPSSSDKSWPLKLTVPTQPGKPASFIELGAGSSISFENLSYLPGSNQVSGSVRKVVFVANAGQLALGGTRLQFHVGSRLSFERIAFEHSDTQDWISSEGGSSKGQIADGSIVELNNDSRFFAATGSKVDLKNVFFDVKNGEMQRLAWGPESELDWSVGQGSLNLGKVGVLGLGKSSLKCRMKALWAKGGAPAFSASDLDLAATITDGTIRLNDSTSLPIKSAVLSGKGMRLESNSHPILTGKLDSFAVDFSEGSYFQLPDTIKLSLKDGAKLTSAKHGIQFTSGIAYPVGQYDLDLPFSVLTGSGAWKIHNGVAAIPLDVASDGSIQSPPARAWSASGDFQAMSGGNALSAALAISNGSIDIGPGRKPTLSAILSGKLSAKVSDSFRSKGTNMGKCSGPQFYAYPLSADVGIDASDLQIPQTSIRFGGDGIAVSKVSFEVPFFVSVPKGKGEHQSDCDENSADGTHGPKDTRDCQEVCQVHAGCTFHLYLVPGRRNGVAKVSIESKNSGFHVSLSDGRLNAPLTKGNDYKEDGCDLWKLLLTFMGVSSLDGIVNGIVNDALSNAGGTWVIQ